MKRENIPNAPILEFFLIFATYGGLLLVILTELFWKSSGMALLGMVYLIFGAPVVMLIIASKYKQKRMISKYHRWVYICGVSFFAVAPLSILVLFLLSYFFK